MLKNSLKLHCPHGIYQLAMQCKLSFLGWHHIKSIVRLEMNYGPRGGKS